MHPNAQTISYLITAVIVGLVLFFRLRNVRKAKRLRLGTIWIVPIVYGIVFAIGLYEYPPVKLLGWLWLMVAVSLGAALGWHRGKLMRLTIDPITGVLNQQSSPAAFLFIVLLIVVRQAARYEGAALGINVLQTTGILMAFALGLFTATRAEIYLRAKRLLAEPRLEVPTAG